MGKTFTLDPISKRRLDNFGEEDQFYIRDHHEAIISEEMFEKAQEILKRRAKPRRLGTDGKREKFSRNMPLAVCWNVASAVVHLQGEAGTAVHSITRLSGNV